LQYFANYLFTNVFHYFTVFLPVGFKTMLIIHDCILTRQSHHYRSSFWMCKTWFSCFRRL